jgi:hypothetical protein
VLCGATGTVMVKVNRSCYTFTVNKSELIERSCEVCGRSIGDRVQRRYDFSGLFRLSSSDPDCRTAQVMRHKPIMIVQSKLPSISTHS